MREMAAATKSVAEGYEVCCGEASTTVVPGINRFGDILAMRYNSECSLKMLLAVAPRCAGAKRGMF